MNLANGQSIEVKEYSIRVIDKNLPHCVNPVGVVTVMQKLQIRIGQTYRQLLNSLSKSNMYVMLQPISSKGEVKMYYIVKINGDGAMKEPLGVITVAKGKIVSYQFNHKIRTKDVRMSAIQSLRFTGDIKDVAKQATSAISALVGIPIQNENWGVYMDDNSIKICFKRDELIPGVNNIYYYISKTRRGNYFVNTVGYDLDEFLSGIKVEK